MPLQAPVKPNSILPKHLAVPLTGGGSSAGSSGTSGSGGGSTTSTSVVAHYASSATQSANIDSETYASIELNIETAVTASDDVTTSPFVYAAPAAQTVDVLVGMYYSDNANFVRPVLAINVNGSDVEAVFMPIPRSTNKHMNAHARLQLDAGDEVRAIFRIYSIDGSTSTVDVYEEEIVITTT